MTGLPVTVRKRPFAVEPRTGLMIPDGIFDSAIHTLRITCFVTNVSGKAIDYMFARTSPRVSTEWELLGPWQVDIEKLGPGASALVSWLCSFRDTSPGKKRFTVEVGGRFDDGHGFDGFIEQRIFVSKTRYDDKRDVFSCEVPEGEMELSFDRLEHTYPIEFRDSEGRPTSIMLCVPQRLTAIVRSRPGQELSIPFADPWWKVVAWVVAAIAAIAAIIEASQGKGTAYIGITGQGHDDPTDYHWCVPDPLVDGFPKTTPAGFFAAIANAAILIGMSDAADPWCRGRVAAAYNPADPPADETVELDLSLPPLLEAGGENAMRATWRYLAFRSSGDQVEFNQVDDVVSAHQVLEWEFRVPDQVASDTPLIVACRGRRAEGSYFAGDELFGYAEFLAPDPKISPIHVPIVDDGREFDEAANDGWFTAAIIFEELIGALGDFRYRGEWTVSFFAQDVNDADEIMPPEIAATHIGGVPVLSPLAIASRAPEDDFVCPVVKYFKVLVT